MKSIGRIGCFSVFVAIALCDLAILYSAVEAATGAQVVIDASCGASLCVRPPSQGAWVLMR